MFEHLINFILDFFGLFKFWVVIDEFERGIVLTLGRPRTKRFFGLFGSYVLEPGVHLMWPFALEEVLVDNVVPTTTKLESQSLTTLDGYAIVVSAVITWKIRNIEKVLLEVEHPDQALEDSAYGIIGKLIGQTPWEELCDPDFSDILTKAIRRKAFKWGIEVEDLSLADKTRSKSLRIIGFSEIPVAQNEEE